jgi:hypothetical protein
MSENENLELCRFCRFFWKKPDIPERAFCLLSDRQTTAGETCIRFARQIEEQIKSESVQRGVRLAYQICFNCKFCFRNYANPNKCTCTKSGRNVKADGYCEDFQELVFSASESANESPQKNAKKV